MLASGAPMRALLAGRLPARLCQATQAWGVRAMAGAGPTTATPPPDLSRAGTADLCDVHVPEPVDQVTAARVAIMEPIFRHALA